MRLTGTMVCGLVLGVAGRPGLFRSRGRDSGGDACPSTSRRRGRAISKYVYGQFIEHLGRCIYGGLWAEMLEDRKFFYPVDGAAPGLGDVPARPALLGRRGPSLRAARPLAVDDRRRAGGGDHERASGRWWASTRR